MITSRQRIQFIIAGSLLAGAAFSVGAQTPAAPGTPAAAVPAPPAAEHRMHRTHDGKAFERMQERRAQRQAELKASLKLQPQQESAWAAFSGAMQPPARPANRVDRATARAEFQKLTTPERLARMQARQAERSERFARRADATRSFYAALTPEQQKTFDEATARRGTGGPRGAHPHHAPHAPAQPPAKG
ncbi:MAG: hypothetical protein EOO22_01155 [Comamonadaceae bacterium]|nr:MAG: hypothetical protein EOO22_01155 [Comamonadaceae bacterium]